MRSILLALVCCFLGVSLLGCAGGCGPTLPDIRLQPPLLFERGDTSVPGPRLVPQTYYAAPTYSAPVPSAFSAPCLPAPVRAAPCVP